MDIEDFAHHLHRLDFYDGQVAFQKRVPERSGRLRDIPPTLGETGRHVCAALGIEQLYEHQIEALKSVRSGDDVVLNNGSAGGKSLAFQIPAAESALAEPPGATLIICPYKPVARAQESKFRQIAERIPELGAAFVVYDGDLSPGRRRSVRERPLIITNPDMLHRGVLPNHPRWSTFFSRLRLVVVEEMHAYSGLFGANVASLFRRLWRVCSHYGASPQLIGTSSTLANPAEHAQRLTGRRVRVLNEGTSRRGAQTFVFWRPRAEVPSVEAGWLLGEIVARGCGGIAFSRARVACELIAHYARMRLEQAGGEQGQILAYRGGYLPEERRALERRMATGQTVGVSTTNLLELGLDLPGLDAAIVCGWPGSLASFFQQAGRVGRSGRPSLVIFVGLHDPVNNFLMAHPDYVFERAVAPGVVELENPHVLAGHLRCAAQELPVTDAEADSFGPGTRGVLEMLRDRKKLFEKDGVWYNATSERPAQDLPLRGYFDRNVIIQDADSSTVVAEVDWLGAHSVAHPRAIYVHEGRQYLVKDFDRESRRAYVTPVQVDYYTNPLGHSFVESVDQCLRERQVPGGTVFFGEVTAGAVTTGFEERRYGNNELVRSVGIELPPVTYQTMGLWACLSEAREAEFGALGLSPEFYGLGNALRIVLPLFMTCDVLDLRPWSGQTNFPWPALYFYERYPRGLGFTGRVFEAFDEVMTAAAQNLAECLCARGCPRCVGDPPRPFMVNNPELEADLIPPKAAVRLVLAALRTEAPIEELLVHAYGAGEAEELINGREQLVAQRRAEAAGAPSRTLPSDSPAETRVVETPLPLQIERGIRRRIEKMRTSEVRAPQAPVGEARVPAPEKDESLAVPDREMRRRHRRMSEQLQRRARTGGPEQGPETAGDKIAAEAVRRMRARRRRGKAQDDR